MIMNTKACKFLKGPKGRSRISFTDEIKFITDFFQFRQEIKTAYVLADKLTLNVACKRLALQ